MIPAGAFVGWNEWVVRNCGQCAVRPCEKYDRLIAEVNVAGSSDPVKIEPLHCPGKVKP